MPDRERRSKKVFAGVERNLKLGLLVSAVALVFSGCVTSSRCQYIQAPAGAVFFDSHPVDFSQVASLSNAAGPVTEHEKIDYLLDRIADSRYQFQRNGEMHDGKTARLWFLYKMSHWVSGIKTAQDFIGRVATASQKTGQPYLVQFPNGNIYSLDSVLRNELDAFEKHLTQLRAMIPAPLIPKSAPVFSSTAVAATAVASAAAPGANS